MQSRWNFFFQVGDYVEHAIFGVGKVMALSGQGENQRVGIEFKDGIKKKLVVKFANLKKVDSPWDIKYWVVFKYLKISYNAFR